MLNKLWEFLHTLCSGSTLLLVEGFTFNWCCHGNRRWAHSVLPCISSTCVCNWVKLTIWFLTSAEEEQVANSMFIFSTSMTILYSPFLFLLCILVNNTRGPGAYIRLHMALGYTLGTLWMTSRSDFINQNPSDGKPYVLSLSSSCSNWFGISTTHNNPRSVIMICVLWPIVSPHNVFSVPLLHENGFRAM